MDDETYKEICKDINIVKKEFARLTPATPTTSLEEKDVMTPTGENMRTKHITAKNAIYHSYALGYLGDIVHNTAQWQERRRRIMEGVYAGIDPDTCPKGESATALYYATRENDIPLLQKLLEHGADPAKKINQNILLHAKIIEVATLLVNKGASLHPSDHQGLLQNVISGQYSTELIGYYASLGISKDSLSKYYNDLYGTFMTPIQVLIEKKMNPCWSTMSIFSFVSYLEALRKIGVTKSDAKNACASFEKRNKNNWNQYHDQMDAIRSHIESMWLD